MGNLSVITEQPRLLAPEPVSQGGDLLLRVVGWSLGPICRAEPERGPGLALLCSSLLPQDTGLYYHRYLQEVINVLETDGHFREKLQAANAEDIKVRCGWVRARWVGMRGCVLRGQSLSLGRKKSLLQVA